MNELLQKHGCANVFTVPEGLKELMSDITREVLREQPPKIFDFIANYLSALLITREHGLLAVKILDDLCDCRPSVSEHLLQLGLHHEEAHMFSGIIKEEIEAYEPSPGKEKLKETEIVKKVLQKTTVDEETTAKICQVARNAFRDYWYRKKLLQKHLKVDIDEPWELAAQHTLEIYKKTKPSFTELSRATQRIQAAYRGYHVRRHMLEHLLPKKKKQRPKEKLPGPPLDIAKSREIELGPIMSVKVQKFDVRMLFDEHAGEFMGLRYNPMKTITHVPMESNLEDQVERELGIPGQLQDHDTKKKGSDKRIEIGEAHERYIDIHDEMHQRSDVPEEDIQYYHSDGDAPSVASSGPGTADNDSSGDD